MLVRDSWIRLPPGANFTATVSYLPRIGGTHPLRATTDRVSTARVWCCCCTVEGRPGTPGATPAEGWRRTAGLDLIPAAALIDVTGAGHMVAGDDNDVFSDGLKEFLDDRVVTARS